MAQMTVHIDMSRSGGDASNKWQCRKWAAKKKRGGGGTPAHALENSSHKRGFDLVVVRHVLVGH
jgi:imidazole glycerol phosphate synthase subunit HisF